CRKTNDGIVLLKLPQQFSSCTQVALIEEIIKVKNEIFLAVQLVETRGKLKLTLDSHEVLCPFVYVGSINPLQDLLFLPASCIIEKMSSYYDKANQYYYYLQYPNLTALLTQTPTTASFPFSKLTTAVSKESTIAPGPSLGRFVFDVV
ncbi:unnamed protein product, partial [Didymodactylos carnosus]